VKNGSVYSTEKERETFTLQQLLPFYIAFANLDFQKDVNQTITGKEAEYLCLHKL
jgi:hypothetical protein